MPGAPVEYRCGGENGAAKGSASRCSRLAPGSHSLCAGDGAVSKVSLASPLLHGLPLFSSGSLLSSAILIFPAPHQYATSTSLRGMVTCSYKMVALGGSLAKDDGPAMPRF